MSNFGQQYRFNDGGNNSNSASFGNSSDYSHANSWLVGISNVSEIYQPHDIISFEIAEDCQSFTVVKRYKSNLTYAVNPPVSAPDRIEAFVYHIVDGKIQLKEKKFGKHTPAHYVPEKFEF